MRPPERAAWAAWGTVNAKQQASASAEAGRRRRCSNDASSCPRRTGDASGDVAVCWCACSKALRRADVGTSASSTPGGAAHATTRPRPRARARKAAPQAGAGRPWRCQVRGAKASGALEGALTAPCRRVVDTATAMVAMATHRARPSDEGRDE